MSRAPSEAMARARWHAGRCIFASEGGRPCTSCFASRSSRCRWPAAPRGRRARAPSGSAGAPGSTGRRPPVTDDTRTPLQQKAGRIDDTTPALPGDATKPADIPNTVPESESRPRCPDSTTGKRQRQARARRRRRKPTGDDTTEQQARQRRRTRISSTATSSVSLQLPARRARLRRCAWRSSAAVRAA